jgi:hypothetical protein
MSLAILGLLSAPATPPSKGGEMYQACIQYFTFSFEHNSLTILLYLTPKVDGYSEEAETISLIIFVLIKRLLLKQLPLLPQPACKPTHH